MKFPMEMQAPLTDAHTHQLLRVNAHLSGSCRTREQSGSGPVTADGNHGGRAGHVLGAAAASHSPELPAQTPLLRGMFPLHSSERGFPAPEIQMAARPPAQSLHKKPPPGEDH